MEKTDLFENKDPLGDHLERAIEELPEQLKEFYYRHNGDIGLVVFATAHRPRKGSGHTVVALSNVDSIELAGMFKHICQITGAELDNGYTEQVLRTLWNRRTDVKNFLIEGGDYEDLD